MAEPMSVFLIGLARYSLPYVVGFLTGAAMDHTIDSFVNGEDDVGS